MCIKISVIAQVAPVWRTFSRRWSPCHSQAIAWKALALAQSSSEWLTNYADVYEQAMVEAMRDFLFDGSSCACLMGHLHVLPVSNL